MKHLCKAHSFKFFKVILKDINKNLNAVLLEYLPNVHNYTDRVKHRDFSLLHLLFYLLEFSFLISLVLLTQDDS